MSSLVNAARITKGSVPYARVENNSLATLADAEQKIHQLQQHIEVLEHELNTDHLTGIANRRAFTAHTQRLRSHTVVALVDLDDFKHINDTHGHHVGDLVLKAVAHRLRAALAGTGLAARLGGDEFALIITYSTLDKNFTAIARQTLTKAVHLIAAPTAAAGQVFTVNASIGAALAGNNESLPAALHQADVAMYRAKTNRLGVTFYDPALDSPNGEMHEKPQIRVRDLPTNA